MLLLSRLFRGTGILAIKFLAPTIMTATKRSVTTIHIDAFNVQQLHCPTVRSSNTPVTIATHIQIGPFPSLSLKLFYKNKKGYETLNVTTKVSQPRKGPRKLSSPIYWFRLFDSANGYSSATVVSIPSNANVDYFLDAVKGKLSIKLASVDAIDIVVYKNKDAFDTNDGPLRESASLNGLGKDDRDNALVVVIPPPLRIVEALPSSKEEEKDKEWSDWYNAITNAKIRMLSADDEWTNDSTSDLIQIKRMTVSDLPSNAIPESAVDDHDFEKSLDVIKLPLPIPNFSEMLQVVSDVLFVRPDEYELFRLVHQHNLKTTMLTGNPGISKSWFYYKFILFWSRPDIYMTLRAPQFISSNDYDQLNEIPSPGSLQVHLNEMQLLLGCERPKKIIRTVSSTLSYIFENNEVRCRFHMPSQLAAFAGKNDIVLWEPGDSNEPVVDEIGARILAALSADTINLYKEFGKFDSILYMPCPSEIQLQLMGLIFRQSLQELAQCFQVPNFDVIHDRYLQYGPFIRPVLTWPEDQRTKYRQILEAEVASITIAKLESKIESNQHVVKDGVGLSSRLVCYTVDRTNFDYHTHSFAVSCENALTMLSRKIYGFCLGHVWKHLQDVNQGLTDLAEFSPYYLERIVTLYAVSMFGLKWSVRTHDIKYNCSQKVQTPTWGALKLKMISVAKEVPTLNSMQQGVLYHPQLPKFPVVDMYWKNNANELCGIQVSRSKGHDKEILEYDTFFNLLECNISTTKLNLYILILPLHVNDYESSSAHRFWKTATKPISEHYQKNIKFYILIPPNNFCAQMNSIFI